MAIGGPDGQVQPATPGAVPPGVYWDTVYQRRGAAGVSWFQATPQASLDLIRVLGIPRRTPVVDAGAGAGALTGQLAAAGFTDLTAVDVSAAALEAARQRLAGQPGVTRINWIRADLLSWRPDRRYGLWHDRAVFHFLTEPAARAAYLATVRAALTPGGAVVLATFAPDGPGYCSGLPVARYSPSDLARALGTGFTLTAARSEQHNTPDGAIQPFTWVAGRLIGPP
ncbi:MAG: class I SAM-dependent methyltransferase [Actinomycetota bacterium]|nr:class I SAM-dependent methyltransferase [Actinomycetota bacterium]